MLAEIKENEVLKMLTVVVLTISLPKNLIYEQNMMEVLKKAIHNALNKTVEKLNYKR